MILQDFVYFVPMSNKGQEFCSKVFFAIFTLYSWNYNRIKTISSWLNWALRDDEAVYWVSIGHYEAVTVGNWRYWVSRGHFCLYILNKVEIWTGVTDALLLTLTDWLTDWHTLNINLTPIHSMNAFNSISIICLWSRSLLSWYIRYQIC